ncbi:hypothetical protein D3C73_768030 [compost metagenome]
MIFVGYFKICNLYLLLLLYKLFSLLQGMEGAKIINEIKHLICLQKLSCKDRPVDQRIRSTYCWHSVSYHLFKCTKFNDQQGIRQQ